LLLCIQQNFGISNFGILNFQFYQTMVNGPATINANMAYFEPRIYHAGPLMFDIMKFCHIWRTFTNYHNY